RSTVDVYQPYPEDLIVTFRVKPERAFPDTPVVIRGEIRVEGIEEPVGTFSGVFGDQAFQKEVTGSVDLMDILNPVPTTALVTGWVEAVLMPEGTDEHSVDVATATAAPDRMTTYVGNPIRVYFHDEPMPEHLKPIETPEPAVPATPPPLPPGFS